MQNYEMYETSSAQQRLYLIDQLQGLSITYNMPIIFTIEGEFDPEKFVQAFAQLVQRHEALRTDFVFEDGQLLQKVYDELDYPFDVLAEDQVDLNELAREFVKPFDLNQAPLFRVQLIKNKENQYLFLLDMHHIISDGRSIQIIFEELIGLYLGMELPPVEIQYVDFVTWQNDLLQSEEMKTQEKYWLAEFDEEIPVLNLPVDYARTKERTFEGDTIAFGLSQVMTEKIHALADEKNSTVYIVILAIFNILLTKCTGQDDIVVGCPIAGRNHVELENTVGMFVNTLALRNRPCRSKRFSDFLDEVTKKTLLAYENQDYQFEMLVEKLSVPRNRSRNPIFDVALVMQHEKQIDWSLENLRISPYLFNTAVAKFDLTLQAFESDGEIEFYLIYSTELFTNDRISRWSEYLINIITQIASNPDRQIAEIDMLSQKEKEQLVFEFNHTRRDYPETATVTELFEEQVKRKGDRVAVTYEAETLCYQELNQRANQLARFLRENGVGPDQVVGLMLERSVDMIVGILGIIKAGGAYMAIDPDYPVDRIHYMLTDSKASILIAQSHLKPIEFAGKVVDPGDERLSSYPVTDLSQVNQPTDLAYIIYTSGSTGRPKGVMVEQKSLLNLITGLFELIYVQYDQPLKIALLANYVFDGSIKQIFASLLLGHSLYIVPDDVRRDGRELIEYYQRYKIDISDGNPTHLKILLNSPKSSDEVIPVQHFIIGGEALAKKVAYDFLARFGTREMQITNIYGPAECTVDTTAYLVGANPELEEKLDTIPIGKPIANKLVYILDESLQLLPLGVPGEVYISGEGVARGYLNNPESTKERFIANPFVPGKKMYRTGDLARRWGDGTLEFVGRVDHQVKIRGYRIEIGEIEAQLREIQSVEDVVVIASGDDLDSKYLVAYVVSSVKLNEEEVRQYLEKRLPEYMIPTYFTQIDQIPATANGKVDYKKLPEPASRGSKTQGYQPPQSELEKRLVAIWEKILKVEQIGVTDNFFVLGGHSLKATKLISRISRELDMKISLKKIFELPTILELAEYLTDCKRKEQYTIEKVEEREYYPVSSAQKRIFVIDRMKENSLEYNMPGIIQIQGDLQIDRLNQAFQSLLDRHESLRTSFDLVDGDVVQKIQQNIEFTIEYRNAEGRSVEELACEFIKPFDLQHAPLIRVGLFREHDEHILIFDLHHIISDGVSMSILFRELLAFYHGEDVPELALQYKDFSHWQNQFFLSTEFQKQEKYWLERFGDELPSLNLPTDYQRPVVKGYEGSQIHVSLDRQLYRQLKELTEATGATLYMVLLAGYTILLNKYTGQEDILIGSPIAGRSHADLENMIGMFVNTLVLRNFPEGEKRFIDFLAEVKQNSLTAFDNQDYQFEMLVEKLGIERDLSRNPLFDVMFALQNTDKPEWSESQLSFTRCDMESTISKFDLSVVAAEVDDLLEFIFEYSTELFTRSTIERLAKHFTHVLQEVVENSFQKISAITVLSPEEIEELVYHFNSTEKEYPLEKTVVTLFEEQVAKNPDNIAIQHGERKITYRELNNRSNQLAWKLKEQGIGSNQVVALIANRSVELLIGMLGVLKAEGGYLPIDPEYPSARIRYILADSGTNVLLVEKGLESVTDFAGAVIRLDCDQISSEPIVNLTRTDHGDDMAYVVYTSGSTGRPKGVMISHTSLVNLIYMYIEDFNVTEGDRSVLYGSISFDPIKIEIYPYLAVGATIYLIDDEIRYSPIVLNQWLTQNQITKCFLPTHMAKEFLAMVGEENVPLELLVCGGDRLKYRPVKECNFRFVNGYGPTENAVMSTYYDVVRNDPHTTIPIGKPVSNHKVYILDDKRNLVPIGVVGEIYLGGVGLAKGYINAPDLTAEKFIPNPFIPGERVYRTGDMGKYLADGNIEFVGRKDHQVKIRGYRIELGAIERTLLNHSQITEAVVITKEDQNGAKELIAYIVSTEELEVAEIRNYLSEYLPAYMIPAYFVFLEKMPITATGKVDLGALPGVDKERLVSGEYVEPTNPIESQVVAIWEEVLGIRKPGINDQFYALGGNSLKAIHIASKIQRVFGIDLPVTEVMKVGTIQKLALSVQKIRQKNYTADIMHVLCDCMKQELLSIFCFPSLLGYAYEFKSLSNHLVDYAVYSFDFDENYVSGQDQELMERYIEQIRSIQPEGPYTLIGYSAGCNLAFEVAKLLEIKGFAIARLVFFDGLPKQKAGNLEIFELEQLIENEIKDDQLKRQIKDRAMAFNRYITGLLIEGQVSCDIHVIKSDSRQSNEEYQRWKVHSTGEMYLYEGTGRHFELINEKNAGINSEILKDILSK